MKPRHAIAALPLLVGLVGEFRPKAAEPTPPAAVASIAAKKSVPIVATVPTGPVAVHYINVGQAASAVVDLQGAAILIDAGGETTTSDVYAQHLMTYLNAFFAARPQLNHTLDAIIISHPHIDHTKNLVPVIQGFTVKNLIDGGDDSGSGISQLKKARAFAQSSGINYMAIADTGIGPAGRSIKSELGLAGTADVVLLSGSRDCENQNNNSLAVQIKTDEGTLLFTGDSEDDGDGTCGTGMLEELEQKYGPKLDSDVYHVAHHGSYNGTAAAFMQSVTPKVSVISAGNAATQTPGPFHAFQFGHPREVAIDTIVQNTSLTRTAKQVTIFPAVKQPKQVTMSKAVYCTCWDGDIVVSYAAKNNTPTVTTTGLSSSGMPIQ